MDDDVDNRVARGIPRPANTGKIIAVHINYPSRAAERGHTPAFASYFLKPSTSIAASGENVERPLGTELLAFEGEIALIIGRITRNIQPEDGWASVEAITAANDLGVYDLRLADKGSNLRSKGGDGFTPLGPVAIRTADVDPTALRIRTWVNNQLVQDDNSATLFFPFAQLVADLSQLMTLEPGDVILTGTPAGASVLQPGDVVEVEVDSPTMPGAPTTGRLRTTVIDGIRPISAFSAPPQVDDSQRADAWGSEQSAGITPKKPSFTLTAELSAKINSVSTATLSSQLRKRGLNNVSIDGLASTHPSSRLVGRARTLRFVPNREDLFDEFGNGFNAQKRAFDSLGAGDVLVIEARGERGTGTVGDILALRAQVRGAAGIITDGGVRDLVAVTALDILTYHAGSHPAVLGRKHVPWDTGLTVACGGTTVQPGDVIVGDADGLIVIPPKLVEEVVDAAIEQELEEAFIAERVGDGESVNGLYPLNAEWRGQYQQWRRLRK